MKHTKAIISALLTILLTTTIASALIIGYNRSETSRTITITPAYDTTHDTTITLDAPESLTAGQEFTFSGRLVDKETGQGVAGKKVFVRFDGFFEPGDCEFVTDSDGRFSGVKTCPSDVRDTEELKATFAGGE